MGSAHSSSASYFAGGRPKDQGQYSTVEKLTYTSETMALLPSGSNLSSNREWLAGTSSPSAGYFGGGKGDGSPSITNVMDKMTFSTDSTSYIPGGNLSSNREGVAATGNTTHGYFGGGNPGPFSTVDKLTYSNDTTAVSPSAALSVARYRLSAIGNDTHGYFGNGNPGPTGQVSDKLTYATDTSAVITNLAGPGERAQYATAGNLSQGYFIGGTYPVQSTVFKLNYATDVSLSAPSAYLPVVKRDLTGSSARMDGVGSPNIV